MRTSGNAQPSASQPRVLRAETSEGEHDDEPSEDALLLLLEDLQEVQDFVIVEDTRDADGQTDAQVMREPSGFLIERRGGSEDTHEHAVSPDLRLVHEDLTTWAFGLPRGDVLSWQPGLPPE